MRQRFFERNIRAGLSDEEAPNRAIKKSLKDIVLDQTEAPSVFAFNHNGVTLFAQRFEQVENGFEIIEPRLLNGAQTVTTFDRFLTSNHGNQRLTEGSTILEDIWVMCKIITRAEPAFVVAVTMNNNRQNPVMAWHLRANDTIQLELQEKFRKVGIFYERQKEMFGTFTDEDLEAKGISEHKAVKLLDLAKTFLASDGLVDKMSNMPQVFENESTYREVFCEARLKADCGKLLLCYRVQYNLRKYVLAIMKNREQKYAFMGRARNLLWTILIQGVLNDESLDWYSEEFGKSGQSLVAKADYQEWIAGLATTRARPLISNIVEIERYAEEVANEKYGFLRSQAVFKKCMDLASDKWGWVHKRLK